MSSLGNKQIMSNNLKRLMEQKGVDRSQICAALDIRYSTFSDWVNAKTYPRIDKIEMLANYFGVTKSALVEENTADIDDYYSDEQTAIIMEELRTNRDLRILFDAAKDISVDDVQKTVEYVEFLKSKENGG